MCKVNGDYFDTIYKRKLTFTRVQDVDGCVTIPRIFSINLLNLIQFLDPVQAVGIGHAGYW